MRHLTEFHDALIALPSVIAIDALVAGGIEAVPEALSRALRHDQVGEAMEEAEAWYREGGEERIEAGIAYALLLEGCDLLDEAVSLAEELRGETDRPAVKLVEAEIRLERGEEERAEAILEELAPGGERAGSVEASVWGFAADLLLDLGRDEEAIDCYEAAVSGGTDNYETVIRLAELHRDRGNWRRAAECFEGAAELGGDVIGPWKRAAECWRQAGQLSRSLDARAEVLERRSGDAETWAKQGVGYRHVGKIDEAIAAFEKATNLASERPEYWIELAHTLRRAGRVDRAIDGYKQVLEFDGAFVEALEGLAAAALEQGDLALAEQTAGEAVEADDERAEAWYLLGRARRRSETLEGAEQAARRAIELDGEEARYHRLVGEILLDAGRVEEGFEALGRAVERSEAPAEIVVPFALALLRSSEYGRLRELLQTEADWAEAPVWELVAPVLEVIVDGIEREDAPLEPVIEAFEAGVGRHAGAIPLEVALEDLSRYALVLGDRREAVVEQMLEVLEGREPIDGLS